MKASKGLTLTNRKDIMPTEITKKTTVKNFLKENVSFRVGSEAIPIMVDELNEVAKRVAKKAQALAKADDTTTILERHMEEAFKGLGGIEPTAEGIFKALDKMKAEEVAQLSKLIAKWAKKERKTLGLD